jgi:hypothetical protein
MAQRSTSTGTQRFTSFKGRSGLDLDFVNATLHAGGEVTLLVLLQAIQATGRQLRHEIQEMRGEINTFRALVKSYHERISKVDLTKYIDQKIEDIYYDHACWRKELGERQSCHRTWVKELSKRHNGAELSDEAQQWMDRKFTSQVPSTPFP